MIKKISLACLTLFPLSAFAEGYVITPRPDGGIKAVSVTSITDWVLSEGYGGLTRADTDKATGVILEEGKPPRLTRDTLETLDKRFGGDGTVNLSDQVIHLEDADGELGDPVVISLDDIPEGVPIELFEDDISNHIVPLDGLWHSAITDHSQTGCPPQLAPMIESMVGSGSTTNVQFSNPYHPTDFSDQLGFATWKRVSINGFVSDPFSPIGGQEAPAGMEFSVQYGMIAVSPVRFDVWSRVSLKLPAMMAAIVGGSSTCIAEGRGYYAHAGE